MIPTLNYNFFEISEREKNFKEREKRRKVMSNTMEKTFKKLFFKLSPFLL